MKIIRSTPLQNSFFQEEILQDGNTSSSIERGIINIYDDCTYQTIQGFGGAFTESAAYNYAKLTDAQKREFMEKHFSREHGIGYNFGRTHINSCDFSLDIYTYVEDGDWDLSTFSIERDKKYIIPFIKDAMEYCEDELVLFASPWSPPAYMKENESPIRGGALKEQYKTLWARYYAKYIKAMAAEGIAISAISVQNEPNARQPWESCSYTPVQEREFLEKHLFPVLDEEELSHVKVIIWDHNKERVYDRTKEIFASEIVQERVWAVGHHWYSGDHFEGLQLVHEKFGKALISTEICGIINQDPVVVAENYGRELCEDFNHFTSMFCDWNLLLSEQGGPYHNRTENTTAVAGKIFEDKSRGCYAPVLLDNTTGQLIYTPIYYYIGHFSKYIQKGAVRIATTRHTCQIFTCAFKNPDGSIVLIAMNPTDVEQPAAIRYNGQVTKTALSPHSIITAIL